MKKNISMKGIPLQAIVERLPGHVWWKDKNLVYLGCNNRVLEVLGLSAEAEFVGKTDHDLWEKKIADQLKSVDLQVLETGESINLEEVILQANGKPLTMLTNKSPFYDQEGAIAGIVGTSTDITDRKIMEQQLKETTHKLENVLDTIPGHVYWKDNSGAYLGCNELQAQNAGLSKQDMIGKTDYDMPWRKYADTIRRVDQDVMQEGTSKTIEESCVLFNGKEAYFLSRKSPLYDLHEENKIIGIIGISFEITEHKQTEINLLETKHKLEGMTLVSASIAHELRTPLQSIAFGIEGLRQFFPPLLDGYRQAEQAGLLTHKLKNSTLSLLDGALDRMDRETKLAATAIDLLLMNLKSKIDASSSSESFLITGCIDEALERYPFKEGERKLIQWSPKADFVVKGKVLLVIHVLFNLIKNSLYHIAKAGKGTISIWVENDDNKYYGLYFKDTATGISANILPHIFDRFYSKRESGTGIGLSFCKMVMESLGGKIFCNSVENEYTLFKLVFPVDHY